MCLVYSTPTADEGFAALRNGPDRHWETDLAEWAAEENENTKGAYDVRLYEVHPFKKHSLLKYVRKICLGRHRAYSCGKHTDCQYTIFHVILFKRDEEDQPGSPTFQKRMVRQLTEMPLRLIEPPINDQE